MSGYIGPSPVPQSIQRRQTFTATAAQTTFGTTGYTDGDFIDVYLNGVKLVGGTDYTATNGTDVVLTTGAAAGDILDFVTFNSFQLNAPSFDNSLTLQNATEEDTDGGRESTIIFKGEQSGGEISTLAEIEASHDGTADDEKGDLIFRTNDGADGSAPTERLRIDSAGRVGIGTSSPQTPLHITSAGASVAGINSHLVITDDTPMAAGVGGSILFEGNYLTAGLPGAHFAGIKALKENGTSGQTGGHLAFYSRSNGSLPAERMRITADGYVTTPNQPAFHAYGGVDQTANGVTIFTACSPNISSSYNTSNGRFTAPVGGTYKFTARIMKISTSGDSLVDFHFRKNGVQIVNNAYDNSAPTGKFNQGVITYIVTLSQGDYVEVYNFSTSTTNKIYQNHREFTGFLIG